MYIDIYLIAHFVYDCDRILKNIKKKQILFQCRSSFFLIFTKRNADVLIIDAFTYYPKNQLTGWIYTTGQAKISFVAYY